MKRRTRPQEGFPESINRRLNAYALAAGAAGVGILALTKPAEGKIVYTPAHIPIIENGGAVELDLNHLGINDFQFFFSYTTERRRQPEGFHQSSMTVYPVQQSNRVRVAKGNGEVGAAALSKGKDVGPHSPFQAGQSALVMWACAGGSSGGGCGGPWFKVGHGYVGLKIVIKGKVHFGWARIRSAGEPTATITGYAYETIPNKPIVTGATKGPEEVSVEESDAAPARRGFYPASLGLLAAGASEVGIWRREQSARSF